MSYTTSYSWTRTNAREVASKVSADLGYMRSFYGQPLPERIKQFEDEITEYLAARYLNYVIYGYKRDGNWVVALRYSARSDGSLANDGAGRLVAIIGKDITGASFYSYLVHNSTYDTLTEADREKFLGSLPFQRGGAAEPGTGSGYWETDRSYASGDGGVSRSVLRNT
jgi:hypothetical protein